MTPKVKVGVALNKEMLGKIDAIVEASEYLEVSPIRVVKSV